MRIVLTGGGTGGHVYPALAAARYIKEQEPTAEILFMGTEKGLESQIIPDAGFPLETISAKGLSRKISPDLIKTFFSTFRGGWEAKKILKRYRPQLVMGTGGYVCGPVVFSASLMGIPCLLHEQNVIPGMTNRMLFPFVKKVCLSFDASQKYFKDTSKTIVTGNPRASEVVGICREEGIKALGLNPNKKTVLIVGGSRGAERINQCVTAILPDLAAFSKVQFIYVTGNIYYNQVMDNKNIKEIAGYHNLFIRSYIAQMPLALAATDLIISRAGATMLAEITARGIPSVLIPSPNVTNNHQVLNAHVLADAGAAEMILERDLTGGLLRDVIFKLLKDTKGLGTMSHKSRDLGYPDSAHMVYRQIKEYLK
ncbi:undecaprenyldiphospho-muramoylpentapeptide beta-N-acetylglucosaminyltransferase [Candidatus Contubernalis alkaliaceticus]|uniref:undecaprenyldiphospho-muramoylpentapeptide beta-N-acetylglucosaminyltransferase n=1 Tax=Candidatus Contubernalis alkaliaceticus TaxID=338645 RepID=UPI001F4C0100|nr:undecaprenyldiphospho-muramoylpentapeptide beta-N-acetylglucosaminyltransferase [Candidatus Contubernalis alkalaceticus]UNC92874.1 undecaprenyldiphospho-muramoylpentapeptide beta-N-acetylglucosaminyltransferase [Candidatus Contubernalis alkalaceticus]